MPYTINRYSSNSFDTGWPVTIPDNTINTTATSLQLLGRGTTNYGQIIAEDYLYLLENFAGTSAPANPVTGQEWLLADPTKPGSGQLQVFNGVSWSVVGGANVGPVANRPTPTISYAGQVYFANDAIEQRLYLYDGSKWSALTGATQVNSAPASPLPGALWFDTSLTPPTIKMWNGTAWTPVITATPGSANGNKFTTASAAPLTPSQGDLWYNTTNNKLYTYNGVSWVIANSSLAGGGAMSYQTVPQLVPNSALTILTFDTGSYDTVGTIYNVSDTTRLTVPANTSYVKLNAKMTLVTPNLGEISIQIYKNGASTFIGQPSFDMFNGSPGSVNVTLSCESGVLPVSANDYFQVVVYQNTGSTVSTAATGAGNSCWFGLEIIS